ncbi:MAG: hypothetical protein VYE73_16675 [Acidobacteriota bacterium]|nr:hypothetical protein [Acidobacteriota bacterium]
MATSIALVISLGGIRASAADRVPAVVVPGVTGTQLRDPASGGLVWGTTAHMMRPRDLGYSIALPLAPPSDDPSKVHPQARYEPVEPLWVLRLLGFRKEIYRPLAEEFQARGFKRGDLGSVEPEGEFFFFAYDWRRSNEDTVVRLSEQLHRMATFRGEGVQEVDLLCQSNAARICRWAAKYGALPLADAEAGAAPEPTRFRIRKLLLVSASNSGSLRILEQLHRGRRYLPGVGRKLSQETLFTIRPLFDDLPLGRSDAFFGTDGRSLDVDLGDAAEWVRNGWSVFGADVRARIDKRGRTDLFATHAQRLSYLEERLDVARRAARLLAADSPHFSAVGYYLLENRSQRTIDRALLIRDGKGRGTYFTGDDRIKSVAALDRLATSGGDGHAPLASQQDLSPQEKAATVRRETVVGGHFEMLIGARALELLFSFLAD